MVEFSDRIGDHVRRANRGTGRRRKEIFNNPLHPYTQGLLSSFPPLHGARSALDRHPRSPPNMADPPSRRAASTRAVLICQPKETRGATAKLREVLPGHWLRWHPGMPLPEGAVEAGEPKDEKGKGQA